MKDEVINALLNKEAKEQEARDHAKEDNLWGIIHQLVDAVREGRIEKIDIRKECFYIGGDYHGIYDFDDLKKRLSEDNTEEAE